MRECSLQVGYESPSQFSREYSRFFGQPPMRDIKARQLTAPQASAIHCSAVIVSRAAERLSMESLQKSCWYSEDSLRG